MSDLVSPVVWSKPVGKAADPNASRIARIKAYRDEHTTVLKNGVRPIPKIETVLNILKCHDMFEGKFEARLIVEVNDFRVTPYLSSSIHPTPNGEQI